MTSPAEQPIIEDHAHGMTIFSAIPSRRMVFLKPFLLNYPPGTSEYDWSSVPESTIPRGIFICAEPSPDVADSIASAFAGNLSGSHGIGGAGEEKIDIGMAKSLATVAQRLFKRSQGLQLYRDGMYYLCQALMNGVIAPGEYATQSATLLDASTKIIHAEIKGFYAAEKEASGSASSVIPNAAAQTTSGGEVAEANLPAPRVTPSGSGSKASGSPAPG